MRLRLFSGTAHLDGYEEQDMGQPSWSVLTHRRLEGKPRQQSVTCQVCGKPYRLISALHLRTHGLTLQQYKRQFGIEQLQCEEHLYRMALRRIPQVKEEEVIAFLQRRLARGESLAAMVVRSEHRTYFNAAVHYFRYWRDALLAAGIDPMTVEGHTPHKWWSRQRVLEAIRERIEAGESMHIKDILQDSAALYSAAFKYAGGWRQALKALGYDYRQFCRDRPKWSRKRVVSCILQREAAGQSLKASVLLREDSKLLSAGQRHFGAWVEALRASGIDPEAASGARIWTVSRLTQEIRRLDAMGAPLSARAVQQHVDSGLVFAAYGICGSWDNALLASGYDPAAVRGRLPTWTRASIAQAISDRAAARQSVRTVDMAPRSAVIAAYRLFGSWDAALEAAGALHLVTRPHRWSKQAVVDAIQERDQAGEPLNATAVRRDSKALTTAARRYFGNWSLALRAAGFDPDRIRRHRPKWTVEAILGVIRRRDAAGESLGSHSCGSASMANAARRLLGGWPKALAAAGVRPAANRLSSRGARKKATRGGRKRHDP